MKPRTQRQKEIATLTKQLPKLSKAQMYYAFKHCFKHYAYKTKKRTTCSECGFVSPDAFDVCPNCKAHLEVLETRKRVFREESYFCVITTKGNYQVVRYFIVKACWKVGKTADYFIKEVVQRWMDSSGKIENIARLRCISSYYYDVWNLASDMEIRSNNVYRVYDISPTCVYPRQRVIPDLKRNGYDGNLHNLVPTDLFVGILTDSRKETLLKAGQINLFRHSILCRWDVKEYWASIKICMRNHYNILDVSMWKDYIDLLKHFGKDVNNPKYVCPKDLKIEHDRLVNRRNEERRRLELETLRLRAIENESKYTEMKGKFFGLSFTDGIIQVRVLESVDEFAQEGLAMHHCVFAGSYYLKPDSLILSATIDGQRVETVEVSLKNMTVVQSRGVCNENTEHHESIINLVNKNIGLIRSRMTA